MADLDDLIHSLEIVGVPVVGAEWTNQMRDFTLRFGDGRALLFADCLQVSLTRPLGAGQVAIGGWWSDEPSPVLESLGPEVRFLYQHLVFELGEGLLRVACRGVETKDE